MTHLNLNSRQRGVALILSLLLLFILTLVAVSSFTSSHVQERAASNNRLQTMAFEAAAAGANNAIEFFMTNVEADAPDTLCGRKDHLGWDEPTEWRYVTYDVDGVRLQQRMYCLNDEYPCGPGEVGCVTGARPPRSQLFVASRGTVEPTLGDVVAFREVEVRITRRNDTYLVEGCGAICFPACEAQMVDGPGNQGPEPAIDFPSSNVFTVDGDGGPAVTTGRDCPDSGLLDAILDDLNSSRLGNYDGGIHQSDPGQPWDDPNTTDRFREQIRVQAEAGLGGDLLIGPGYPGYVEGGEHGGVFTDLGNTEYGTYPGGETITYIQGDLVMGGNISGAGIMMVEGNISWNGTPDYKGLIVTLGGTYTIDGGGVGGNHAGSVVVLNNNNETGCGATNSCSDFGAISWQNTGGGTAEYNWDCDALTAAFELVYPTDFDADPLWGFDCERGPATLFETPAELVIASWRENIGWREEFFAAE
ncbi:MAG: hypothetical protein KJN78_09645 [Gammaproteobacteria bacterium]|nr:hypothetical protein [Gammaproteobacteria bacterium]